MRWLGRHIGFLSSLRWLLVLVGVMGLMTKAIGQNIWAWDIELPHGDRYFVIGEGGQELTSPSSIKPELIVVIFYDLGGGLSSEEIPIWGNIPTNCTSGSISTNLYGINWSVFLDTHPFGIPSSDPAGTVCLEEMVDFEFINSGYYGHTYSFFAEYQGVPKLISQRYMESPNPERHFQFEFQESYIRGLFEITEPEGIFGSYNFFVSVSTCDSQPSKYYYWSDILLLAPAPEVDTIITTPPTCPGGSNGKIGVYYENIYPNIDFVFTIVQLLKGAGGSNVEEDWVNEINCDDPNVWCGGEYDLSKWGRNHTGNSTAHFDKLDTAFVEIDPSKFLDAGGNALTLKSGLYAMKIESSRNDDILCDKQYFIVEIPEKVYEIDYTILSKEPPSCLGNNDGFIEIKLHGGVSPYFYGEIEFDSVLRIDGLSSTESFMATINDNCSEIKIIDEKIDQGAEFKTIIYNQSHPTCGNNGSVDIGTDYQGEKSIYYSISLPNGTRIAGPQSETFFSGLPPGNLVAITTIDGECEFIKEFILEGPPDKSIGNDHRGQLCSNGDGKLILWINEEEVIGDSLSVTYTLINDLDESIISGVVYGKDFLKDLRHEVDVPPGDYQLIIENNCKDQLRDVLPFSISQMEAISVEDIVDFEITCADDTIPDIPLNIKDGTPPYNVFVNDQLDGESQDGNYTISNLGKGTYKVRVEDSCKIAVTEEFSINVKNNAYPIKLESYYLTDKITCYDSANASTRLSISGGFPFLGGDKDYIVYLKDGGEEIFPSSGGGRTEFFFTKLDSGNYYPVVKDSNGCEKPFVEEIMAILPPQAIEIFEIKDTHFDTNQVKLDQDGNLMIRCHGETVNFVPKLETDYRGGTGVLTTKLELESTSVPFTNLGPGNYTFHVVDDNGCPASRQFELQEPDLMEGDFVPTTYSHGKHIKCVGENNGEIKVSISGGLPPYDFAINGEMGVTDDPDGIWTFSGLTAESPQTSYSIVVTDYLGCQFEQVVNLEPPTKLLLEYSIISDVVGEYEIPCTGESATIWFTGSGGDETNGYRLQINGEIVGLFDTDGTIEKEFLAGSYSVKMLDNLDCYSDEFELDLTEPDETLSFTTTAIHPNCIGGEDGSISIDVFGGVPSYQYSLDGISWQEENLFPGLESGEYEVFIKDNNECTTSKTIIVPDNPNPLTISHTSTNPPSCHHGTDGSITVQTTNFRLKDGDMLSYFISGGHYGDEVIEFVVEVDPIEESHFITFENLWDTKDPDFVTKNYEIWVEDFYECVDLVDQYIGNLALIAPDPIRLSAEVKAPSCYNGENGWFVISAQGGVPPYEFSLDNLSFVPSNTSDNSKFNFSDLSAGDYTVYVRDANFKSDQPTCLAALDIHLPQGLDIDVIEHVQNISCVGGDDGAIVVDVETYYESSPFEYQEDRLGLDWFFGSNPLSEGNSLTKLSRGVYTLKMSYDQDSLVCREQEDIAIISPNIPLSIANIKTYPTSCGEVNDGRAIVNFTGGWTDSTTYYNLNDEGWNPTLGSSIVINELSIGNHNLKIGQSVFNCQDEISFTIQKSKINIDTVFIQAPTCSDGSNGMVILKASNVVEPRFLIADSSYNSSSGTYSGLSNGKIYNLVVIDDTNTLCASDTISFSFPDCDDDTEEVVIAGVPIIQPVTCETSGDGIAQVIATGGLPPYQYMLDGVIVPSGNLSNLSYGIHKIIVLDELGKKDSVEFFMEAETSLSISSIATTKVTCSGGCDGSAIIDVEGGSGSNEVRWEDDFIGHERRELCPGIYSFQVIDKRNEVCLLDGEVNISAFEPLAIEVIRLTKPTCPGGSNGKIGIRGLGGSGSYSYAWGYGSTESGLVNISAGFYEVTLTDNQLNCSVTEEIELSDIPTILVSDTILGIPSCRGSSDGSIELVLENAVSPLVQWDDGGMGIFRKNLSSGTYHFTITSSNSCQISGEIELPARDPLSVDVSKTDNQCYGLCQGTIDLSISGGLAPYYIEWGSGLKSPHRDRLCNGVYDYQVIDRLGCVVEGSVEIRSPDPMSIELISKNDVNCRGQSDGSLEISASGGTGNYSYEWNTGDNTTSLKDLAPGTYNISISDENGCSAAATYTISQPQSLFLKYENIIDPSCDGGNDGQIEVLAAGGNSGYQYSWDNLSNASFIDELYEGDYQLTILDEKGCDYTKTFTLEAPQPLSLVNTRALDPICFDESSGLISIEVIGGAQPYSYSWGSGQTTSIIEDIPYGEYELTVTDNNGCVIASSFQLTNPEPLSIKGIEELVMLCEGGSVFISPEGDWDKYLWQGPSGFSSGSHRIEASLPGEYTLSVQNEDGCEVSQSFSIEWSESILNADFIRISEAVVNEPLIFVDLSLPVPDEVEWVIPESENIIVTSMDDQFIEVVFTETGAYELGLVAYYQSCIAELFKTIEIEAGTGESTSARVTEVGTIYTSVFPNPSQGNVEVIVNARTKDGISVSLLDMSRYELFKEDLSGKLDYLLRWDLSEVPSGVYFLVVQAGNNVQQKRILLVR